MFGPTELIKSGLLALQAALLIVFARKARAARAARESFRRTRAAVRESEKNCLHHARAANACAGTATHAAGCALRSARRAETAAEAAAAEEEVPAPGVLKFERPGDRNPARPERTGIRLADLDDDEPTAGQTRHRGCD